MNGADPGPRDIYSRRLESRRADLAASERRLRLHAYLQLATLLGALAVVISALNHAFSIAWDTRYHNLCRGLLTDLVITFAGILAGGRSLPVRLDTAIFLDSTANQPAATSNVAKDLLGHLGSGRTDMKSPHRVEAPVLLVVFLRGTPCADVLYND
jgi:hypothetical protein